LYPAGCSQIACVDPAQLEPVDGENLLLIFILNHLMKVPLLCHKLRLTSSIASFDIMKEAKKRETEKKSTNKTGKLFSITLQQLFVRRIEGRKRLL